MFAKTIFTASVAVALSACASVSPYEISDEAAAELAKYEPTGETKSCLSTTAIRSIDPVDERHFLIKLNNGDVYLSAMKSSCHGAGHVGNRLQYEITGSSLCQNQIIQVVDNSSGFLAGSCGLNKFEKLEPVPELEN